MAFTFVSVDFDEFHSALPASVRVDSDRFDGLDPLAFILDDGRSVTYRLVDGLVSWHLGTSGDAATIVELDAFWFGTFAAEYLTAPALQIQGRLTFHRGDFSQLDRWEPLLRLLFTGRPVYEPADIDRTDLERVFIWGDDPIEEIARFYDEHGFAVVRGFLEPDEVTELDGEIDRLAAEATSTDGSSWWVTADDGIDHVCQLHFASLRSQPISRLETDPRVCELVTAIAPGLVAHATTGNGHFAVIKNPGVTGGLTDLAWHVDCGLGGHPVLCPSLHIGIQTRSMSRESGPMMFLAGSHRTSPVRPTSSEEQAWPVVTVLAEPGDVTLHNPDTVHAAPPPAGEAQGRRTIYLSFGRPELSELFGFKEGYDHIVFANDGHAQFPT